MIERPAQTVIPILGDPVAQVATPPLWNAHFASIGADAVCVPIHLKAAGLEAFVEWMRHAPNVPGFLTTIPHKAALPALCDTCRDEVAMLGVANTVRRNADGRLECAMFDGVGMIAAIEARGAVIAQGAILIIGAGAAGGAIAHEALTRGATRIVILDHVQAQADRIAGLLRARFPEREVITQADAAGPFAAIVNASPLGNAPGDPHPWPLEAVGAETVIADAVTDPSPTPWLAAAKAAGLRTVPGSDMAAFQAALMRAFIGIA
ncbi:shikimate dehydrogenase [Breoghania sp. L-A4]|uniref:shikimate dehydrogenase family protein n=1 Tax=Breoghania sp. L-A4 TaxID=2304600 RepID=UPI000E359B85|nr:shikimate dehydrogenase [Breoghania sp. L-A4]AXS41607.1 shikimate dehydrogenase [Breoghania sp. L-A4]